MTKKCATCKKGNNATTKNYLCVTYNVHTGLKPSCTGLSQVAFNVIKELVQLAMLLCNNCVSSFERDNFRRFQKTERMNTKLEAETQEFKERL